MIAAENGAHGTELLVDESRFCVRGTDYAEDFVYLGYDHRPAARRPHLGVLVGPSGRNVLECRPADHAHHLGVWWSHGDVNGVDFYLELAREDGRHGRIVHVAFDEVVDDAPWFGFEESLEWRDPDGVVLVEERRTLLAHFASDEWYSVDLDSVLRARVECTFGETHESMLPGVRVAEALAPWGGGTLVTADGGTGEAEAMGRAPAWIDCSGARAGFWTTPVREGIAVMSHPDDVGRWWARDYGLVSPRPGHHFVGPTTLGAGEELRHRQRLLVHAHDAEGADVAGHYERWCSDAALE